MSLHDDFVRLVEFDLALRASASEPGGNAAWRMLLLNTLARARGLPAWCPDLARLTDAWGGRPGAGSPGARPPAEFLAEAAAEFVDWCLGAAGRPAWLGGLTAGDLQLRA